MKKNTNTAAQTENANTEVQDTEQPAETNAAEDLSEEELYALCQERICPDCPQMHEAQNEKLRALADAENYKRRMTKEKDDHVKFASEKVLEDIVPTLDTLELALQHGKNVEGCQDVVQGVEMTHKLFLDTLHKHGLEQLGEVGEEFDPAIHEALAEEEREDMDKGMVCQIMQRGYRLKGRLLRPAKVMVSKNCKNS
ncbi:MAG: nucleotide exchange factor GrpE [Thermodesulfobacteriota bacterium]